MVQSFLPGGDRVEGTLFKNCLLNGTNMKCLGVSAALFEGAQYDSKTFWPKGFDPVQDGWIYEG